MTFFRELDHHNSFWKLTNSITIFVALDMWILNLRLQWACFYCISWKIPDTFLRKHAYFGWRDTINYSLWCSLNNDTLINRSIEGYKSRYLSICLYIQYLQDIYLPVCISNTWRISIYLSVCISNTWRSKSIHQSIYLSIYLSIHSSVQVPEESLSNFYCIRLD